MLLATAVQLSDSNMYAAVLQHQVAILPTVCYLNYSMYGSTDSMMNKRKFMQGQEKRLSIKPAW